MIYYVVKEQVHMKSIVNQIVVAVAAVVLSGCAHTVPDDCQVRPGARTIAWKDIGSLSDAKKVEERCATPRSQTSNRKV